MLICKEQTFFEWMNSEGVAETLSRALFPESEVRRININPSRQEFLLLQYYMISQPDYDEESLANLKAAYEKFMRSK